MGALPVEVPVEPGAEEARDWILRELAEPQYEAARPNWFDLLAQRIAEWFASLSLESGEGGFPWWLVVLAVLVAGVLLVAFLVYGLPRRNRRSAIAGALFGDEDARDAEAMLRAAREAAASGDYTTAIVELYRALARRADERGLVDVFPGTTAHGFAEAAARAFPAHRPALAASAEAFDGVRYLGRTGSRESWEELVALEAALRDARPATALAEAAGAAT